MGRRVCWFAAWTIYGLLLAPLVTAQQAKVADALNAEVTKLYRAGKYLEATPLAKRNLASRFEISRGSIGRS